MIRFRYPIIVAWAVAAVVAFPRAARVNEVLQVTGQTLSPTESSRVQAAIEQSFARPIARFIAVGIAGPVPVEHQRYQRLLQIVTSASLRQPYIQEVFSYQTTTDAGFISDDRQTTFLIANFTVSAADSSTQLAPHYRDEVHRMVDRTGDFDDFKIFVTGGPALDHDTRQISAEDARRAELRSLGPSAVILVLAFGAIVAAILPIVVGVVSIALSLATVHLAAAVHPMSVFVLMIVSMVGLGVGIDYSLLIVTRFREEMNRGLVPTAAAVRTILTAGKAVITSGAIVVVGFASLLLTPALETRSVGIGGLIVVTVAVLLSVTLLPATLAILGRAIDWPKWLAKRLEWYHAPSAWERWAKWLSHHPWRAVTIGLTIIAAITWPLAHIHIGLPSSGWFPEGTESSQGVELLEEIGSRGAIQPIRVLFRAPAGDRVVGAQYFSGLKRFSDSVKSDPRIERVRGPADIRPGMSRFEYLGLYGNFESSRERYADFFDAYVSPDGNVALMDVILEDSVSFNSALEVAGDIRRMIRSGVRGLDSVSIDVGGFAASSLDLQDNLTAHFPTLVVVVLLVTAAMLFIAFQSVLIPIKAVIMNLLSVAGAFGLIVLVFQEGVGSSLFGVDGPTHAIYSAVPVLVFAIVFGLSMDYEVFLLSRMKEAYSRTRKNDLATMEGISVTASVITSAALIMIIVFGMFVFSRVFAAKLIGFGLAVAVLLDATLIRMVLVPAFMHIAGQWNWWPGMKVLHLPDTAEHPVVASRGGKPSR